MPPKELRVARQSSCSCTSQIHTSGASLAVYTPIASRLPSSDHVTPYIPLGNSGTRISTRASHPLDTSKSNSRE